MKTLPTTIKITAIGLAAAALLGLTGCGEQPAASEPPPTTIADTPEPTPTPTPSPTPTGPVRAADDPNWTPEQLAAVQIVDAYTEVLTKLCSDPNRANVGELLAVTDDPQYTIVSNAIWRFADNGTVWVGESPWSIPVSRTVSAVQMVESHQEIHVTQCNVDNPHGRIEQNGIPVDVGEPRGIDDYAVRWIDGQGWRVVEITKGRDGC